MFNQFAHNTSVEDVLITDEGVAEHMTDGSHWLGDGGFTVFWMILLMVIVVVIIVLAIKSAQQPTNKDPLEIAKPRYANGEITKKEYEIFKKDLK